MQTVAIAGFISGRTIVNSLCEKDAPSIAAASSSEIGISPTKFREDQNRKRYNGTDIKKDKSRICIIQLYLLHKLIQRAGCNNLRDQHGSQHKCKCNRNSL